MTDSLKLSVISTNNTSADLSANFARIIDGITLAKQANSSLVCFAEMTVSSYGCQDHFHNYNFICEVEKKLGEISKHCQDIVVVLGFPLFYQAKLYNCVGIINNTQLVAIQPKKILADSDIHYESRWFSKWQYDHFEFVDYAGFSDVYIGNLIYKLDDINLAIEICEESWSPLKPYRNDQSLDVILHLSASHFALKKYQTVSLLVAENSRNHCCHFVYCNTLGIDSGRIIYDGAIIHGLNGKIISQSRRFPLVDLSVSHLSLDIKSLRSQKLLSRSSHKLQEHNRKLSDHCFSSSKSSIASTIFKEVVINTQNYQKFRQVQKNSSRDQSSAAKKPQKFTITSTYLVNDLNHNPPHLQENFDSYQEFYYALTLGLFDYLRKSQAKGFVVSLSGGRDSSIVCCLVKEMIFRGCKELGVKDFLQKINRKDIFLSINKSETIDRSFDFKQCNQKTDDIIKLICSQLLITIYQPSEHSSQHTQNAAHKLAEHLGSYHVVKSISTVVSDYINDFEKIFNHKLNFTDHSIVLQNVQSRSRNPFAWLVANYHNYILLNTSNRTEASVGYYTVDGDSCGGLAPISGVSKIFIDGWLKWYHRNYNCDPLSLVLSVSPSAELCPSSMGQSDEKDLMPYEILCVLETMILLEKKTKKQCRIELIDRFSSINHHILDGYIDKFLDLSRSSQWKRAKMAVGFYVENLNVDPKNCQRYPELHPKNPKKIKNKKQ